MDCCGLETHGDQPDGDGTFGLKGAPGDTLPPDGSERAPSTR